MTPWVAPLTVNFALSVAVWTCFVKLNWSGARRAVNSSAALACSLAFTSRAERMPLALASFHVYRTYIQPYKGVIDEADRFEIGRANVSEELGANVDEVARGMGLDTRIGPQFLRAGLGYGGSCFPKDVRALEQLAVERAYEAPLLHAVETVNRRQIERTVAKLEVELGGLHGRTVAVLGLAFKPNTDDVRDAPALAIIARLLAGGARVRAHDPIANDLARGVLGDDRVAFFDDMYATLGGADAVVLATEWNEFRALDFARCAAAMRGDVLIDGRNVFDPDQVRAAGLRYLGVGRVKLAQAPREAERK